MHLLRGHFTEYYLSDVKTTLVQIMNELVFKAIKWVLQWKERWTIHTETERQRESGRSQDLGKWWSKQIEKRCIIEWKKRRESPWTHGACFESFSVCLWSQYKYERIDKNLSMCIHACHTNKRLLIQMQRKRETNWIKTINKQIMRWRAQ